VLRRQVIFVDDGGAYGHLSGSCGHDFELGVAGFQDVSDGANSAALRLDVLHEGMRRSPPTALSVLGWRTFRS